MGKGGRGCLSWVPSALGGKGVYFGAVPLGFLALGMALLARDGAGRAYVDWGWGLGRCSARIGLRSAGLL